MKKSAEWGRVIPALAVTLGLLSLGLFGCGSSSSNSRESSSELRQAAASYRDYLAENAAELSRRLKTMERVIERDTGKEPVPAATSTYAIARVPYGHLDAFVQLYPSLQRGMDGLEEEVPPAEYGGFHKIEKQFSWQAVTAEMGPVSKRLSADLTKLREHIDRDDMQPAQLIAGAERTTSGIATKVFSGDAERWAHIDLIDAAAMTEGIEEAVKAARPLLIEKDPELSKRVEAQLRTALDAVGEYGTLARDDDPSEPLRAGTRFVIYDQVTQEKRWELAEPFKELAGLLAEAEEALADS